MKKLLLVALTAVYLASCTSNDYVENSLREAGFTNIRTAKHSLEYCPKNSLYSTKFTANNISGVEITGVVCSEMFFKNATIRF